MMHRSAHDALIYACCTDLRIGHSVAAWPALNPRMVVVPQRVMASQGAGVRCKKSKLFAYLSDWHGISVLQAAAPVALQLDSRYKSRFSEKCYIKLGSYVGHYDTS